MEGQLRPVMTPTLLRATKLEIADEVNIIVQLSPRRGFRVSFGLGETLPKLPNIEWDHSFAPVHLPTGEPQARSRFSLVRSSEPEIVIARGRVPRAALDSFVQSVEASQEAVAVFSDPPIRPFPVCLNSPAVGDAARVAHLLNHSEFADRGMTGEGVAIAVVDTGLNIEHLRARIQPARLDTSVTWSWKGGPKPGLADPDHGTMCAFDALIGAPEATLLDIAVLGPHPLPQLLSNAIQAYGILLSEIRRKKFFERYKALVVTNSWGVYDPSDDVPAGSYTEDATHPFSIAVSSLVRAGADVVFAAGNCGEECPAEWCNGKTEASIYGANSHPDVLSVGGATVMKERVGYSSKGPGRLTAAKPDLCGYTHFTGSGVYDVDSGTSAAAPVVAGFMAAIRSKYPARDLPPAQARELMLAGVDHLGRTEHDFAYGWGVIDGVEFIRYIDDQAPGSPGQRFARDAENEQSAGDVQLP